MKHSIRTVTAIYSSSDGQHDDRKPWRTLFSVDETALRGATDESIIATAQYLSQWDFGEEEDTDSAPLRPLLPDEVRWFIRPDRDDNDWIVYTDDWVLTSSTPHAGDYVLTAHRHFDYVSLERIVSITPYPDRLTLSWVTLTASDDSLKRELELACLVCGEALVDAEAGDTLAVLVDSFADHVAEAHPEAELLVMSR